MATALLPVARTFALGLAAALGLCVVLFDYRLELLDVLPGGTARNAGDAGGAGGNGDGGHGPGGRRRVRRFWSSCTALEVGVVDGLSAIMPYLHPSFAEAYQKSGFKVFMATVGSPAIGIELASLTLRSKALRRTTALSYSKKYGHKRFGRDFTGRGFFPEWSQQKRIHLMGDLYGRTKRMLKQLLQKGAPSEVAAHEEAARANASTLARSLHASSWLLHQVPHGLGRAL